MSMCDLRNHDQADYERERASRLVAKWRETIQEVLDHAPGKLKGSELEAVCRAGRDGTEAHVTIVKKRMLGGLGMGKFKPVARVWVKKNTHDYRWATITIFDKNDKTMTAFTGTVADTEEMQRELLKGLESNKRKLFGLSR